MSPVDDESQIAVLDPFRAVTCRAETPKRIACIFDDPVKAGLIAVHPRRVDASCIFLTPTPSKPDVAALCLK